MSFSGCRTNGSGLGGVETILNGVSAKVKHSLYRILWYIPEDPYMLWSMAAGGVLAKPGWRPHPLPFSFDSIGDARRPQKKSEIVRQRNRLCYTMRYSYGSRPPGRPLCALQDLPNGPRRARTGPPQSARSLGVALLLRRHPGPVARRIPLFGPHGRRQLPHARAGGSGLEARHAPRAAARADRAPLPDAGGARSDAHLAAPARRSHAPVRTLRRDAQEGALLLPPGGAVRRNAALRPAQSQDAD